MLKFATRGLHCTLPRCKNKNSRKLKVAPTGTASKKAGTRREQLEREKAELNRQDWLKSVELEKNLVGVKPTTNVYFLSEYEKHLYSLNDALHLITVAAQPEMFDCLQNPLKMVLTLNMRTKKTTKFVNRYETLVTLPHVLDFLPKRRVLLATDSIDDVKKFTDLGCKLVGGSELIQKLETGAIHSQDYDTIVAKTCFEKALHKARLVLKDRMPNAKNNRLGDNLDEMVQRELVGTQIASVVVDGVPEISKLAVVIGRPDWPVEKLADNIKTYLQALEECRSSRVSGATFLEACISVAPFDVKFSIDLKPMLPLPQTVDRRDKQKQEKDDNDDDD